MEKYIKGQFERLSLKLSEIGYPIHVITGNDNPIQRTIEPYESERENVWISMYYELSANNDDEGLGNIATIRLKADTFILNVIEITKEVDVHIEFTLDTIEAIKPYLEIYFNQNLAINN